MSKTRRNHSAQFKAKVAIEALAGEKTIHEIAAKHQIHPTQVTQWRRQLIDQAAEVFGKGGSQMGLSYPLLRASPSSSTVGGRILNHG